MADTRTLAQSYPAEVWAALLASLAIIGTLVSQIYKRLNADIKAQNIQLENGQKAFEAIADKFAAVGTELVRISEKIKAHDDVAEDLEELKRTVTKLEITCAGHHGDAKEGK